MAAEKQSMPSFVSILCVASFVFYCAGFLRVELELHEQKKRINALENNAESKLQPSMEQNPVKTQHSLSGKLFRFRDFMFNVRQQNTDLGLSLKGCNVNALCSS